MVKIIGVRFRKVGKIYYFDPSNFDIHVGDSVIVETARGIELGKVVIGEREVREESVTMPLKAVIRMATEEDLRMSEENAQREKRAFAVAKERIKFHELEMKLVEVEYTFDGSKILFYYTAQERVDFRELVRDLASIFRTRIEMRCIGVRDGTKALGGLGMCGRELCCHSFLDTFAPVSIKMAKEQNLPLNPAKISGVCGRLMCCLNNEAKTYEWLNSKCPNVGDLVATPDGRKGEVSSVSVLRQKVKVKVSGENDEKEICEYFAEELKVISPRRNRHASNSETDPEELKALEKMEKEDRTEVKDEGEGQRENVYQKPRRSYRDHNGGEKRNAREGSGNFRTHPRGYGNDNRNGHGPAGGNANGRGTENRPNRKG